MHVRSNLRTAAATQLATRKSCVGRTPRHSLISVAAMTEVSNSAPLRLDGRLPFRRGRWFHSHPIRVFRKLTPSVRPAEPRLIRKPGNGEESIRLPTTVGASLRYKRFSGFRASQGSSSSSTVSSAASISGSIFAARISGPCCTQISRPRSCDIIPRGCAYGTAAVGWCATQCRGGTWR